MVSIIDRPDMTSAVYHADDKHKIKQTNKIVGAMMMFCCFDFFLLKK